jgi:hypothetical protein
MFCRIFCIILNFPREVLSNIDGMDGSFRGCRYIGLLFCEYQMPVSSFRTGIPFSMRPGSCLSNCKFEKGKETAASGTCAVQEVTYGCGVGISL